MKFEVPIWYFKIERMIKMADMEQKTLVEVNNSVQEPHTETTQFGIKSMIYVVRNQQVMIDSDLAMLY